MVRRGKGKKGLASDHIDFESDNEELRDEIDTFHDNARKSALSSYRRGKKKPTEEEVLNVEGDISPDNSSDDGDESSDFDDDEEIEDGITSNQWGRKRREYYNTSYVDEDWGGMGDKEREEAELEEEDALARQKALDKSASFFADAFDDERAEEGKQITKETELEWTVKNVRKLNGQAKAIVGEYNRRRELMSVIVEPLRKVTEHLPIDSKLRRQLLIVLDTYSCYLLNMLFYIKMTGASFADKKAKCAILEDHPVMTEIQRCKVMLEKVDSFLEKNMGTLQRLVEKAKKGDDLSAIPLAMEPIPKRKKANKSSETAVNPVAVNGLEGDQDGEILEQGEENDEGDGDAKRQAGDAIVKNRLALASGKRKKKKDRHAKVANRHRYKEIQKKVRSQLGSMRKEDSRYGGEVRGIRASTIKSTKLIA